MARYVHKSHNVSVLLYHLVCPAKYRRIVFDTTVDAVLKEACLEIAKRYEIVFLEIGTDGDHVHFLRKSLKMPRCLRRGWMSELSTGSMPVES